MTQLSSHGIQILRQDQNQPNTHAENHILNREALEFLAKLHRNFESRRRDLLNFRQERQAALDRGEHPTFLKETEKIRTNSDWKVVPHPLDLEKRWVEITGPTDKKMMINAFNSGASVFMADFEDALSPTWQNVIEGQFNLMEAVTGNLTYTSPEGKGYALNPKIATLMVRPRGWHLTDKHLFIDQSPFRPRS